MTDSRPPSRLELLAFAERVAEQQLAQVRRWKAAEERRVAERERGVAARPAAPEWTVERSLGGGRASAVYVHAGGCHMAGKRAKGVTRDVAVRALAEGVEACPHCRPDTELGVLE
ncbi:DUF6233 domain-containing protein [Streptomyces poonensis]|uniref:Uncharacterized protein n=1 Tax=Streptomyces poonensis TaxID=68255 RepID=A0A918UYB5_9ACTN|nr:DUF6233 domain-containing protein [Streptomyces poonensis]GGZ42656.1 hypothetical protein GCM10010365_74170 [Streptomyces poonensis]